MSYPPDGLGAPALPRYRSWHNVDLGGRWWRKTRPRSQEIPRAAITLMQSRRVGCGSCIEGAVRIRPDKPRSAGAAVKRHASALLIRGIYHQARAFFADGEHLFGRE